MRVDGRRWTAAAVDGGGCDVCGGALLLTIAIASDDQLLSSGRRQSFSRRWGELAAAGGHAVREVNPFAPDFDPAALRGCDGFMWWFAHLPYTRNVGRRLLPAIEHGMGVPVFPSWETIWHFDDKIAQAHLLRAAGIPTPRTWVAWYPASAERFCRAATYPLVMKLAGGITSENVALVRDFDEARYWIGAMFDSGVVSLQRPRALAAAELARRLRGAAKWLFRGRALHAGYRGEVQREYLLLQEFLPDNAFDTRVTVIGNRAYGFRRFNRPGDFRASGSGRIDWDPKQVDPAAVRLAFAAARQLRTQSLAVDVLRRGAELLLAEISYYYEGWALQECPGHWAMHGDDPESADLEWVEGRVPPEDAIFDDFVERVRSHGTPQPANAPADPPAGRGAVVRTT